MKDIRLLNLKLTNFKGIKYFELNAAGNDIKVFGDNATGKTTLFDAFVWLLFSKDSSNSTKFEIKTLLDGKTIHNLDHEVEASLLVDGKQLVLKKVYKEQWTKKRGSVTKEFTGHTTDYFVDSVPSKKKEYEDTIHSIVDEGIFKLLTNPAYFNEQLNDKKRRDLLLEIAGDITDQDVINSNGDLSKLTEILGNRTIEDHKKVIAAKRKEINEELERIPVRIDEIHRGLPDLTGLDEASIKGSIDNVSFEIEAKNEQINSIKNGSEINELKRQISDIDLKIANVRNEHTQNEQQELFKLQTRLQEEQSNLSILRNDIRSHEQRKNMNENHIKDIEKQMNQLRDQYKESQKQYEEQNAQEFNHESECVCPTCEQDLPQDQITEAATKFNLNKSKLLEHISERMETINKEGIELKGKVESIKRENESIQSKIDKITDQGKKKSSDIERLEQEIETAKSTVKPIEENASYIKLDEEKQTLEQRIEQMQVSVAETIQATQQEITELKTKQNELQVDLSKLAQSEQSHKRIKELEEQEKSLAAEFEELEHQLYLTEEFIRTKVNILESKINSKFKYARFKLFETQINGGLREVCETTYEGVPYSGGLNNAARINVGLDIINTLSTHYGVSAPIFVDNAESVTKLIDIDAQLISLVVSEQDKQLRVEAKSESEVA
ncbi:hypothetical protein ACLIBH_07395 [Virgibacillus sp. W0430]|uniref:hypothetical protein n=1 Tax=Virgibacillus sp. W0430 TaxID=3391580 RepID=UPI003F46C15C